MRLTKGLQSSISFAKFAIEHKIEPSDLAKMIVLSDKRARAYERNRNDEDYLEEFELLALKNGFKTEWNGLYPTLNKNGYQYHLPE